MGSIYFLVIFFIVFQFLPYYLFKRWVCNREDFVAEVSKKYYFLAAIVFYLSIHVLYSDIATASQYENYNPIIEEFRKVIYAFVIVIQSVVFFIFILNRLLGIYCQLGIMLAINLLTVDFLLGGMFNIYPVFIHFWWFEILELCHVMNIKIETGIKFVSYGFSSIGIIKWGFFSGVICIIFMSVHTGLRKNFDNETKVNE